jgi:hypothetical protein
MKISLLLVLSASLVVSTIAEQDRRLWIFVVSFEDTTIPASQLAESKLTTFLFLNYWTKLQKPQHVSPGDIDPGAGVTWDVDAISPHSFEQAESLASAQAEDPVLVIWGSMRRDGNTYFLQPKLSIRTDSRVTKRVDELWKLRASEQEPNSTISVPLPNLRYEFAPVTISGDVVDTLRTPWELPLLSSPSRDATSLGSVGSYFSHVSSQGDFAEVKVPSREKNGWIYVPRLTNGPAEFVDFPSGVLAVLRHDWPLALSHFAKIINSPSVSASVRTDTVLLQAYCLSQSGKNDDAVNLLSEKREITSLRTDQYLAMAYIAGISENSRFKEVYRSRLSTLVTRNAVSKAPFSTWWKSLPESIAGSTDTRSSESPPIDEYYANSYGMSGNHSYVAEDVPHSNFLYSPMSSGLLGLGDERDNSGHHSGFNFEHYTIEPWFSDRGDFFVINPTRGPKAGLFAPPAVPTQFADAPQSGLLRMQADKLDDIEQCPSEGYQANYVEVSQGDCFCLRLRDGKHFAKLHIVELYSNYIEVFFVYQPHANENFWTRPDPNVKPEIRPKQADGLLRGTATLSIDLARSNNGNGYNFATSSVEPWNSGSADIFAVNPSPGHPQAMLYAPSQSGLEEIGAEKLDQNGQCPMDDYKTENFPIVKGHFYCLRTRDGRHYAKLQVTDVGGDRIVFNFIYQPKVTSDFW